MYSMSDNMFDDDILQTISYSQTGRIVPHLLTQLSSMQELAQNSNLALQKTMFLIAVHFLQMQQLVYTCTSN